MNNKVGIKIISSLLLGTMCVYTMPVLANTKDETVYSKINNSGENYSTIVSTKLSNDNKDSLIQDLSDLLNIENTNGDETYTQDGNKVVWNANGNNIQYQGNTTKSLPISCSIKYELDEKEINPEDIVGKDGKVKVTLRYTNNEAHTVKVNGKYVKMYTPFVVVAGTIIDNSKNTNIQISNGKKIDNGSKTTLIGMAMPGLQESLNISEGKLNIPSTIEITMDAKEFEMNNIISYATPKVIEEADIKVFNDLDEIYSKVNELQSSSKQLVDGTLQIKDGANKLNTGANSLRSGINTAYVGASTIKTQVAKSTNSLLNDKSSALDKNTLSSIGESASKTATATLNQIGEHGKTELELIGLQASNGANTTISSKLEDIGKEASYQTNNELNTINPSTGVSQLNAIKSSAQTAQTSQLQQNGLGTATYNSEKGKYEVTLSSTTKDKIKQTVNQSVEQMTDEEFAKAVSAYSELSKVFTNLVIADKNEGTHSAEALKTDLKELLKVEMTNSATSSATLIAENIENIAIGTVSKTIEKVVTDTASQVASKTAQSTATKVAGEIANQTAKTIAIEVTKNVANQTAVSVAEKVGNMVKGEALKQVASQMKNLSDGLDELTGGLSKINNGTNELTSGTESLSEGANALNEGMTTFDNEGIEKICNYINGDLKDLTSRVEALKDLADEYNIFTKLNDGDKGVVKFITVIDSLKKENFTNEINSTSNKNSSISNNEISSAEMNQVETSGNK